MLLHRLSLAGTGIGLFLRPREIPIKRGKYICVYSELVCPRQEAERLRGHMDYLVEGGKDPENSYEKFIEGYFQRHKEWKKNTIFNNFLCD